MKTFTILFLASIVLSGCVVSPLYGPDGRGRAASHVHRDRDENRYHGDHDRDDHRGDPYRN